MSARVLVTAEAADIALVAAPGGYDWGELVVATEGSGAPDTGEFDLGIAFGAASPPAGARTLRWLESVRPGAAGPERTIAPAGEGMWSRQLWPASDALFELAPASEPRVLIAGRATSTRALVAERASARGLALEISDRLSIEALSRATCVVLLDGDGMPARAPAVLAARRVLLIPRVEIGFGLQPRLDHLQFDDPDQALSHVESVLARPAAFGRMISWATIAAERHRASRILGRLLADPSLD